MDTQHDDWLTITEAAARLRASTKTVRRMISRGEVEAHRFGPRLISVSRASLDTAGLREAMARGLVTRLQVGRRVKWAVVRDFS